MESLTPNDTKQHENTPPEEQITPVQMRAVTLRANARKFKEISEEIDVPEETIKNWFREGHEVYKCYRKHCYETSYLIGLEAKRGIHRMTGLATDTLRELMSDSASPAIRLKTCEYVLEHSFGHVNDVMLVRSAELQEIENYKSLKDVGYIFSESKKAEMEEKVREYEESRM